MITDAEIADIKVNLPDPATFDKQFLMYKAGKPIQIQLYDGVLTSNEQHYWFRKVQLSEHQYDWLLVSADVIDETDRAALNYLAGLRMQYLNRYPSLADILQPGLEWSELNHVKDEICHCLIAGLNQAAITLTNHFLEDILKTGLIRFHSRTEITTTAHIDKFQKAHEQAIDDYGGKTLDASITACEKFGLISAERAKAIHALRKQIRNGFSHADHSKIFGDVKGRFALGKLDGSDKIQVGELSITHTKMLHGIAKVEFAKANAVTYFIFAYETMEEIVKSLKSKDA